MSENQLKKAARLEIGPQLPDIESKLLLMLLADRADERGALTADADELMDELVQEVNAVAARLGGDLFVRAGINYARVNRVVAALREVGDE